MGYTLGALISLVVGVLFLAELLDTEGRWLGRLGGGFIGLALVLGVMAGVERERLLAENQEALTRRIEEVDKQLDKFGNLGRITAFRIDPDNSRQLLVTIQNDSGDTLEARAGEQSIGIGDWHTVYRSEDYPKLGSKCEPPYQENRE